MECGISNKDASNKYETKIADDFSATDFQKFIYELFDKNGVLNDLRAYLRGHIVDVLKNSEIGNSTKCQQLFTQRLVLQFQAINVLIAEYLLQQKFKYTLSVFISEIPLANMVFNFSKLLMQNKSEIEREQLRFTKSDVWSIINYLGLQCDSVNAENILSTYQSVDQPSLLQCLVKNTAICGQVTSASEIELSQSSDTSIISDSNINNSCYHHNTCHQCRSFIKKTKNKYSDKVKGLTKILEEMQTVYKSEIDIIKDKDRDRTKLSVTAQGVELQRKYNQLEEQSLKRQRELEGSIKEKKKFLWTLAKSLREQHEQLARAFTSVKLEGERLNNKEENLKKQLKEAEQILIKSGDEMRQQITNELNTLESHLHDIKSERDGIMRERDELIRMKLNSEKCVLDKSTLTDICDLNYKFNLIINNNNNTKVDDKKSNVVNYFKKNNNNISNITDWNNTNLYSNTINKSSEVMLSVNALKDTIEKLQEENLRLRTFNTQQSTHISELSTHQARLQAELYSARYISQTLTPQVQMYQNVTNRINSEVFSSSHPCFVPPVMLQPQAVVTQEELKEKLDKTEIVEQKVEVKCDDTKGHQIKPIVLNQEHRDFKIKDKKDTIGVNNIDTSKTLREAKLRLRKLEIEAEAVEKSYLEFRKRRCSHINNELVKEKHSLSDFRPEREKTVIRETPAFDSNNLKKDFDKYLKVYTTHDVDATYFKNKITTLRNAKPIPESMSEVNNTKYVGSLIETPLTEFRKLYNSKSKHRAMKNRDGDSDLERDEALSPIITFEPKTDLIKTSNVTLGTQNEEDVAGDDLIEAFDAVTISHNDIEPISISKENIKVEKENLFADAIASDVSNIKEFDINKNVHSQESTNVNKDNNILVLLDNSIEKINIPDERNGQMEMTIVISPKSSVETVNYVGNTENGSRDAIVENEPLINQSDKPVDTKIDIEDKEIDKYSKLLEKSNISNRKDGLLNTEIVTYNLSVQNTDESFDEESISTRSLTKDSFDNFSADVDNYDCDRSDDGNYSPTSIPKSMDDDVFWNV